MVSFTGKGVMRGLTFKDTGVLLSTVVHPSIENKLFLKQRSIVDQEAAEAAELESMFKEIKSYVMNGNHALKDEFVLGILDNMPSDIADMFNYSGMSNLAAGTAFERDLTNIISSVFTQMEGVTPEYSTINIGGLLATAGVGVTLTYPEVKTVFGEKFIDRVLRYSVQAITDNISGDTLYELLGKLGKIDVLSPTHGTATVQFQANAKLLRFYDLLDNASFTAKNYIVRLNNNAVRVKLGHTSAFRVYMATLSFSNPEMNQGEMKKVYYASRYTRSAVAQEHKRHIRFVYELIGPGLYYDGVSLGECKYLIVNERNGPGIRVFSTKLLIYLLFAELKYAGTSASAAYLNIAFDNSET